MGEPKGVRKFFDAAYYSEQAGDLAGVHALDHFVSTGRAKGFSPNRHFENDWYEWQNPDFGKDFASGFHHYVARGRQQGRDPSPLVDMVAYARSEGVGLSNAALSARVLRGAAVGSAGVYRGWEDLAAAQRRFLSEIAPIGVRTAPPRRPRDYLVFIQSGRAGEHFTWLDAMADRSWDLCLNLYDSEAEIWPDAEYVIAQAGSKATAMYFFVRAFREIVQHYRYVLFLDDDILTSTADINEAFEICEQKKLQCAQMSLSEESNCVWPIFFKKGSDGVRYTNGVEVMMPIYSQGALLKGETLFGQSISGFGLDLALGKVAAEAGARSCAVIDAVTARHLKPIDTSDGGLYDYFRSCDINPKAELWSLIRKYDLDRGFREIG